MRSIFLAIATLSIIATSALGQGVDPLSGTWKLSLEKSTYIGNQPPKSQTNTFTGEGQQFVDTVEGVNAQGQAVKIVFQHIYDGTLIQHRAVLIGIRLPTLGAETL
jgi:hypothetical protein